MALPAFLDAAEIYVVGTTMYYHDGAAWRTTTVPAKGDTGSTGATGAAGSASAYTPATAGDWPVQPTTIAGALDKLAARLAVLEAA